jgi:hypothetical protein
MKRTTAILAAIAGMGLASPLIAHHSFAEFDADSKITVEGTVTEFRLVNPHAMMSFDVAQPDGSVREWKVEFDGRLNLSRAGWVPDTIKVGETIAVTGNPAVSGSPYMFFLTAVKGDGTELIRPVLANVNSLEELRQQRRANRETGTP